MAEAFPVIAGALAASRGADALAREVHRIHRRYALEIVKAYGLCPFVREADAAFGSFVVMLDREPDVASALRAALAATSAVVHIVYPLLAIEPRPFERFASSLSSALKEALTDPPVYAVFHPEMSGDTASPARMIGVVRRAPDPFIQLVPEGLQPGGTVLAGTVDVAPPPAASRGGLDRLGAEQIDALVATLADIRADRDRSYEELVAELA
jgi:hypothetical protein